LHAQRRNRHGQGIKPRPYRPSIQWHPCKWRAGRIQASHQGDQDDPTAIPLWQSIIGKYHPSFIGNCEKAIEWSEKIVRDWLITGMFKGRKNADKLAEKVVKEFSDRSTTYNHARHLHIDHCIKSGLKIIPLEKDPLLQDLVLTVHHAFMHTFAMSRALKIVENHLGVAMVRNRADK
jgi:hypothetical protein